jgi:hypothetical protein
MASNNVHSGSDVQQQSSNQKAPEPVQQVMNKFSEIDSSVHLVIGFVANSVSVLDQFCFTLVRADKP